MCFFCLLRGNRWVSFLIKRTSVSQISWWSKSQLTITSWPYSTLWFGHKVFTQAGISTPTQGKIQFGAGSFNRQRQADRVGWTSGLLVLITRRRTHKGRRLTFTTRPPNVLTHTAAVTPEQSHYNPSTTSVPVRKQAAARNMLKYEIA